MKRSFKLVLHVLLSLAIICSSPFNVYAEDDSCPCDCGWDYYVHLETIVANESGGTADVCYEVEFWNYYYCAQCGAPYHDTEIYTFLDHNFTTELTDLGNGRYLETCYCTDCGYVEYTHEYQAWSFR